MYSHVAATLDPADRASICTAATIRRASGRKLETGSIGALVTGSVAVAQTTAPTCGATAAVTGVAADTSGEGVLAVSLGVELARGAKTGSPPQLASRQQVSAINAARIDCGVNGPADSRRARRTTGRCESLTQPTMPRSLPQEAGCFRRNFTLPRRRFWCACHRERIIRAGTLNAQTGPLAP